jgi:outer membrane protein TolC
MLLRQRTERSTLGWAVVVGLLGGHPAIAQAPPTAERPWAIPESAIRRAEALGDTGFPVPRKQYDLAALVDLAERANPNTRAAWDAAREAAASIGLAESAYLPQLSLQAIGGFQHTPLPAPKNLVPAGYFVSDTREVIPALALKWLLFDFGRREAQLQAARRTPSSPTWRSPAPIRNSYSTCREHILTSGLLEDGCMPRKRP